MCKISIDTVRRANNKTIIQVSRKTAIDTDKSATSGFNVSVSFMGKTYGKKLSATQIRNSFDKALNYVEKV